MTFFMQEYYYVVFDISSDIFRCLCSPALNANDTIQTQPKILVLFIVE